MYKKFTICCYGLEPLKGLDPILFRLNLTLVTLSCHSHLLHTSYYTVDME